ncbi:hypothetical protein CO614_04245 [Lysobacteraceae bacterium NML120232]|nr:hypothetical protein CO608_03600 [Xanthomonadaceae bacterium NML08-0793]PJK12498.1 hypothetical protein CO614_04245 [Xanthomonadaceae bacterium NML120232]
MNAPVPFRQTSGLAVTSLICGILGFFTGFTAIIAIITGHMARSEIRRAPDVYDGDGLAVAGLVTGYLVAGLYLLGLLVVVLFFGGILGFGILSTTVN